jgi:hypothetical protein
LSVLERVERLAENFPDFERFWTLLQLLHYGIVRVHAAMSSLFQRYHDPLCAFIDGPVAGGP